MARHLYLALAICAFLQAAVAGQGLMTPGIGPANRAMGGAGVAVPVESIGALFWNSALISQFESSEFSLGFEIPIIDMHVRSGIAEDSIPGVPASAGDSRADVGIFPLASIAVLYKPETMPLWTFGLGMFATGGLYANYAGDLNNPVLSPPPPNGVGGSQAFSLFSLTQFMPTVSREVNDCLSIGFAPVVTVASLQATPATIVPPDDANGNGFPTFPVAIGTHPTYALGFQVGLYADFDTFKFGLAYKSRGWFEDFTVNSQDEIGAPRELRADIDIPESYMVGITYSGIDCWLFTLDLRYVDNDAVDIFGKSGFNADGSTRGLGWRSVFAAALGTAWTVTDLLTLRAGWYMGENPIQDSQAAFNIGAPVYYQHLMSVGFSYVFNSRIKLHGAFYNAPTSDIRGPFQTPAGPVPGTFIENRVRSNAFLLGAQVFF